MRYGYFDNENREYVINDVALPVSWTNYIVQAICAAFSIILPAATSSINHRSTIE
jgi:cellobiose phosphorylase